MKKILFCAGILALAASCAENEIDSISGQKEATKGLRCINRNQYQEYCYSS